MSCYTRFLHPLPTPASYTRLLHLPATTSPASPASTISSYNRFLAFSMTAPPPEKSISGGYRPAGLRRAPESARLPAGCCLCEQYSLGRSPVLSEGRGYEDSVPSRHKKKQPIRLLFCASAGAKRQKGISGKAFPVPWGCPEDWGYEDAVPSRDKKSSLSGCYFCASEGTRTHTHKGTRS